MTDLVGKQLGQYEINALLGEGGMAAVYRAHQSSVKRDVAIKVIKPGLLEMGDFVKRFEREAETLAALNHPHIVKVFDYGKQDDVVYLVMDLLTGGTLADLIRRQPLSVEHTSSLLDQITSALDHAHRDGIIHRDLKPQNVLLNRDGYAYLTDFGLAKLTQAQGTALTQSGMAMGTPSYMPPEQWMGLPLDNRADIYALGVMLFEMLTGRLPFTADTPFGLMHLHVYQAPPPICSVQRTLPPSMETILNKALAKNPDERFQSAGEVAAAFKQALAQGELGTAYAAAPGPDLRTVSGATPALTVPQANPRHNRRQRLGLLIGAVLGVLVIIVLLITAATSLKGNTAAASTSVATGTTVEAAVKLQPGTSDVTALDDEFDDAKTLTNWKQSSASEGYPNQAQTLDINTTSPGNLYLVPYASTWFGDYRGVYLYKEVTGDFIASTRIKVSGQHSEVPTLPFSLAGLLVRAPRNAAPASWQPSHENWVLIGTGYGNGAAGQPEIETKTTVNSRSEVAATPGKTGWVNLRIARIGQVLFVMSQFDGQEWVIQQRYSRPDLPGTLQVGIHAYSNWNAMPSNILDYNATLLKDAPADLIAQVDYVRFLPLQPPQDVKDALLADQQVDNATLVKVLGADGQK